MAGDLFPKHQAEDKGQKAKSVSVQPRLPGAATRWSLVAWFLFLLGPALACGRFEPRPTPTPLPPTATATALPTRIASATATRAATPTPEATATFTPTPPPGSALRVGQPARVVAPQGINIRNAASTSGRRIGRFGAGVKVTVQEGPVEANGFRWWRVSDSGGKAGWVAERDANTVWLTAQLGDPRPVDRPIQVGDTVVVTADGVALRAFPGKGTTLLREMPRGSKLALTEAPVDVDGLRWWHVKNEKYDGWAAENSGSQRLLSPVE